MSERLRLLQIVDSLEPGGMENILVQLLSKLDPDRYDIEVCCLSRGGRFETRLPGHVKVHVLGKPAGFRWRAVAELRRVMRRGRFDVVHSHHLGGLIYASLACPWPGRPRVVHSEHSLWDADDLAAKRRLQRRLLYKEAEVVFTVSHQQVEQIQAWKIPHGRLLTILNGVDAERFRPCADKRELRERLGLNCDGLWLGMVARFGPQKRHVDLIEAFNRAAAESSQLHLLLVGDGGPEKQRVMECLQRSPFTHRIHWAGFQQDPVPWYQAMDALIISSSNEGLPNAVLEGMACGLPLVANDVCGVGEIARDREHGWIEDLGTVERLAAALRRVGLEHRDRLVCLGGQARAHVQAHFSLDAMIGAYDSLYTSIGQPMA